MNNEQRNDASPMPNSGDVTLEDIRFSLINQIRVAASQIRAAARTIKCLNAAIRSRDKAADQAEIVAIALAKLERDGSIIALEKARPDLPPASVEQDLYSQHICKG